MRELKQDGEQVCILQFAKYQYQQLRPTGTIIQNSGKLNENCFQNQEASTKRVRYRGEGYRGTSEAKKKKKVIENKHSGPDF